MKKYFITFLICISCLSVYGCSPDKIGCYKSVIKKYPNADVKQIPGTNYNFLVKTKDNKIIYVRTMNVLDNNISDEIILWNLNK